MTDPRDTFFCSSHQGLALLAGSQLTGRRRRCATCAEAARTRTMPAGREPLYGRRPKRVERR